MGSHGILLLSLLMVQRSVETGFPAGLGQVWTTPIKWSWLYEPQYPDVSVVSRISVVKCDGSATAFISDVIDQVFLDDQIFTLYTYLLRIEAEVAQVKFVHYDEQITASMIVGSFEYAAMDRIEATKLRYKHGNPRVCWPFFPTPLVKKGDALHKALCEEVFDCIFLTRSKGLVVRRKNVNTERLGLLLLRAKKLDAGSKPGSCEDD